MGSKEASVHHALKVEAEAYGRALRADSVQVRCTICVAELLDGAHLCLELQLGPVQGQHESIAKPKRPARTGQRLLGRVQTST